MPFFDVKKASVWLYSGEFDFDLMIPFALYIIEVLFCPKFSVAFGLPTFLMWFFFTLGFYMFDIFLLSLKNAGVLL